MTDARMAWTNWTRWTVGLALAATACGGGDDDGGTTAPTPTIGVSLASPTVSVTAGQSGTVAATVTRGGGYTGAVNLTVEGAPSTVTATANPAALAGGVTASTITLATTSATPAGSYNLTVRAAGTAAVAPVTTPLTLTITAPAPAPGFTVALASGALSVTQGAAAQTATLNIARTGGFAGAVTVAATGAPAGLTVTPAAATTGNAVAVSVAAASTVAPGTYPVTLTATGAGVTGAQTATLTVTVVAAAPTADFSIGAANVSVVQGGAAQNAAVTVTRTGGFTGGVTLTTTGAPAGLTVTPPTTAVTAGTANIAVQAASSVAPGTYPITVNATGAGVTGTKTATFTVTVTAASTGGGGGNVGLSFCATDAPIWIGFQSDNGAWQRATLGANNTAQVNISGTRGAIAYVVQEGTGATASYTTTVTYGTTAELTSFGANLCAAAPGSKTVTATVVGAGATDVVNATLGDASGTVNGSTVTFEDVQPGPRDLIATRSAAGSFPGFGGPPNRIVLRRNLNPANGSSIGPIDFGGSDSFAPASARLTIAGTGAGDLIIPFVGLQTANGGTGTFFTDFGAIINPTTTPTYYGIPADRLAAGDLHYAFVVSAPNGAEGPDISQGRVAGAFFRTVADRTLTLGPAMNTPTVSSSNTPYPRPRVQLARQAQYGDALLATFSQDGTTSRTVSMLVLASYLQGAASWDVTVPDFTGAPGFDPAWMLRSGTQTDWQVVASGGAGAPQLGLPGTEGATFTAALKAGTLTTAARARGFATRSPLAAGPSATVRLQRQAARVMSAVEVALTRRARR